MSDPENLVPITKSVSTDLFRRVFILYLLIAAATTIIHMLIEFNNTREHITTELETISKSISPGLVTALWNVHDDQLNSIVNGTKQLPVITGIEVKNEYGELVSQAGIIEINKDAEYEQSDSINLRSIFGKEVYLSKKQLYLSSESKKELLGELTLYSNSEVVLDRLKLGFVLIVINSLIKSLVLWALFIIFARIIITKPLAELTSQIKDIDTKKILSDNNKGIVSDNSNEIEILKNALDSMTSELADNHIKLQEHASDLEEQVNKRTMELKAAYHDLELIRQKELVMYENKKQLMADISHELRTPLSVLKLQVEAIQEGIATGEHDYDVLQRKLSQMERVVEDLSIITKADIDQLDLDLVNLDIKEFLQNTYESYIKIAEQKNILFECQINVSDDMHVRADLARMEQVLSNILNNSFQYTDPGGKVNLSVCQAHDKIVISVEDSEPGVEGVDLNILFNRLFRMESSRNRKSGGSGLGLSICQSIIQSHGGDIALQHSQLGGLKVTITLPLFYTL